MHFECRRALRAHLLVMAACASLAMATAASAAGLAEFDAAAVAVSGKPVAPGVRRPLAASAATRFVHVPLVAGAGSRTGVVDAQAAARAFLEDQAAHYGARAKGVDTLELRDQQSLRGGAHLVRFTPRHQGVEIFHETETVLLDAAGNVRAVSGNFGGADAEVAAPNGARGFRLDARDAVALALSAWGPAPATIAGALAPRAASGPYTGFSYPAGAPLRTSGLRAKKVWFRLPQGLVPAWYVETQVHAAGNDLEAYAHVFAADDGRLLYRQNLTRDASAFLYRGYVEPDGLPLPGPQGRADFPHPTGQPDGFEPPVNVPPRLIGLVNAIPDPASVAARDPWLADDATETVGNNVDAYADITWPSGLQPPGDFRAGLTSALTFDRSYDTTLDPRSSTDQIDAATTNLFYINNYLHDFYYDAGFDEAAGNAQADNYGRGGLGGDPILAEAQFLDQFDNSNMTAPADGGSPIMHMFRWFGRQHATIVFSGTLVETIGTPGLAGFGPSGFDVTGDVVVAVPGDGCNAITNAVAGHVVLIDRGVCAFQTKAANAEAAGAIGVIIANNVPGGALSMPGDDNGPAVHIGALSISQDDGNALHAVLTSGPVTAQLQRTPPVDRDADIDATIVAHEWAHYMTSRLISGGNQQFGGMNEGWSDFNALLLLVKAEDAELPANANFNGTYAIAAYSNSGAFPAASPDESYFGLRRYPYSTDLARNPLTFRDIGDDQTLPAGPPIHPDGLPNSVVHNTGEVWASMLWECYAGMLRDTLGPSPRLTFDEARRRMAQYLVAGDKLTPPSPTFIEARDALLSAMQVSDAQDFEVCAAGFAKRGAGTGAIAPPRDSLDQTGVTESYVVAPALAATAGVLDDDAGCDHDGVLDPGETATLTVTVRNTGLGAAEHGTLLLAADSPDIAFPDGASTNLPVIAPYGETQVSIRVSLAAAASASTVTFTATPDDTALIAPGIALDTSVTVDADEAPSATDTFEANTFAWTSELDSGFGPASAWQRVALGTTTVAHAIDTGAAGLTWMESPSLTVGSGDFGFTFLESHEFEQSGGTNWDGGVIEISTDDGGSWQPIPDPAINPGYEGVLTDTSGNPLGGRDAFVGTSAGYPDLVSHDVSFGTTYAGQSVRIRFGIGTDAATGSDGWNIDDVAFRGIDNQPFFARVPDNGLCAGVAATKTVAGSFAEGGNVTYTVVLANTATGAQADNAGDEFTDVLPAGLGLVSASATAGTAVADIGASTVHWNGALAANGSVTISIDATIDSGSAGQTLSNQGTVHYDSDGDGSNDASGLTDDPALPGASDPTDFVAIAPAALTTDPAALDFGAVELGASGGPLAVTLTNSGQADLQVTGIPAPVAPFAIDAAGTNCATPPFALPGGASCRIAYTFTPEATGSAGQSLAIQSDAGNATVVLDGNGIQGRLEVAPATLDFGSVAVHTSAAPLALAVSNGGDAPLTVTAVDAPAAPFAPAGGSCGTVPFTLDPGASCTLGFGFTPIDTTPQGGTLQVHSAVGDAAFDLAGVGVAGPPALLAIVSGSGQSAVVGTPFAVPLAVHVSDAFGNAVAGATVAFAGPPSGAGATVSPASAVTDGSGNATVAASANTVAGSYDVVAGTAGTPNVVFALTNTAGAAASLAIGSGSPQTTEVGTAFAAPLVAHVSDADGNGVAGVAVNFVAPASGPGATLSSATATTDANGDAGISATANALSGSYTVDASAIGVASAAAFALTNSAGAAASIAVTGGSPQSTAIETAFADPLAVHVADADGNAVAGATVTFQAPASGAGAVLSASSAATDADGNASVTASANAGLGDYSVSATVTGVAPGAQFALSNTPGDPAAPVVVGGSPQSTTVGTGFAVPLGVQVTDAGGNPLAGIEVAFTAPANGAGATLSAASASTDANGIASITATANDEPGSYSVAAHVDGTTPDAGFDLANTPAVVGIGIGIDDGRDDVRYGQVLDYVVVLSNSGPSVARHVTLSSSLPPQIDPDFTRWICTDAGSGDCSASGDGALADSEVTVPAGGTVTYLLSAPVRLDAIGSGIETTVHAMSPDQTDAADAADATLLVTYRDGFDLPYASLLPAESPADAFAPGDRLRLTLADAAIPTAAIETLLGGRADDGSGFRLERYTASRGAWLRLVATDPSGNETASLWIASDPLAAVMLTRTTDAAGRSVLELANGAAGTTLGMYSTAVCRLRLAAAASLTSP
jgi:uncharacterized repeat protein (TIGR01451 family)